MKSGKVTFIDIDLDNYSADIYDENAETWEIEHLEIGESELERYTTPFSYEVVKFTRLT